MIKSIKWQVVLTISLFCSTNANGGCMIFDRITAELPDDLKALLQTEFQARSIAPSFLETRRERDFNYWTAFAVEELPDPNDGTHIKQTLYCRYLGVEVKSTKSNPYLFRWECDDVSTIRYIRWQGQEVSLDESMSASLAVTFLEQIKAMVGTHGMVKTNAHFPKELISRLNEEPLTKETIKAIGSLGFDNDLLVVGTSGSVRECPGGSYYFLTSPTKNGSIELEYIGQES